MAFFFLGVTALCFLFGIWAFHVRPEIRKRKAPFRTGANIGVTMINDYIHLRELRKKETEPVIYLDLLICIGVVLIIGAIVGPFIARGPL